MEHHNKDRNESAGEGVVDDAKNDGTNSEPAMRTHPGTNIAGNT